MENNKTQKADLYNPDVLNCIANLSNDEVFTPPTLANQVLDLLPQELFKSKSTKFLDPFTKSGVFLREIVKRLDKGIESQIKDRQKRIDHILHNQVFGIACTELTSLLSRRSVYCSKSANGKYSVSKFSSPEGNILYNNLHHTWINGKCKYCGASKDVYDRGSESEQYAYQFIHTDNPEKFFNNMKFDVIIGNPPYQMSDGGGTGDSAKPLYHLFWKQAIKLNPRYVCFIIPSRWMKGGKGLDSFRESMKSDTRIRYIFDFEDAKECFPGLHIDGGVCYLLWDESHSGSVEYHFKSLDGTSSESHRYLKTQFSELIVRDFRQLGIIEKSNVPKEKRFSTIVKARNPFGFNADFFNNPQGYKEIQTYTLPTKTRCLIYGVKGKKGGAKRVSCYIDNECVRVNRQLIDRYKLFFSKAYMTTSTVPPDLILGLPSTICTETFLSIGDFCTITEMNNCLSYIKTKFFRALLFFNRHSLNISRDSFDLIPLQDFSHPWTDEMLYKKYKLTKEEIDFIESMIKPME